MSFFFPREMVEEFRARFPGRCIVCSYYRFNPGRPEPHPCIENPKTLTCAFGVGFGKPCGKPATHIATFNGRRTHVAWCAEHVTKPIAGSKHGLEKLL